MFNCVTVNFDLSSGCFETPEIAYFQLPNNFIAAFASSILLLFSYNSHFVKSDVPI